MADRAASLFSTQAARVGALVAKRGTDSDGTIAGYRLDIGRYAKGNPRLAARMAKAQAQAISLSNADVNAWALSLLRLKYAPLAEAFERETVPWLEGMFANWPEQTGTSKALLAAGLRHNDSDVRMIVAGGAPYTWFIRYAQIGAARFKWRKDAAAIVARIMAGWRFDGVEAVPMIGEPPWWVFRYAAEHMQGGRRDPQAYREAWARRNEKPPPDYRLPSGAGARGDHLWTEWVYRPGMAAAERIASGWVDAVERAA